MADITIEQMAQSLQQQNQQQRPIDAQRFDAIAELQMQENQFTQLANQLGQQATAKQPQRDIGEVLTDVIAKGLPVALAGLTGNGMLLGQTAKAAGESFAKDDEQRREDAKLERQNTALKAEQARDEAAGARKQRQKLEAEGRRQEFQRERDAESEQRRLRIEQALLPFRLQVAQAGAPKNLPDSAYGKAFDKLTETRELVIKADKAIRVMEQFEGQTGINFQMSLGNSPEAVAIRTVLDPLAISVLKSEGETRFTDEDVARGRKRIIGDKLTSPKTIIQQIKQFRDNALTGGETALKTLEEVTGEPGRFFSKPTSFDMTGGKARGGKPLATVSISQKDASILRKAAERARKAKQRGNK